MTTPKKRKRTPTLKRAKTGKRGKPPYEPTVEQRELVGDMVAVGITRGQIAKVLHIAPNTVRQHFAEELAIGDALVLVDAYRGLKINATTPTDNHPGGDPASIFFLLKTKGGFRETTRHEHTGKDGQPIDHAHIFKDLEKLDAGALEVLYRTAVETDPSDR